MPESTPSPSSGAALDLVGIDGPGEGLHARIEVDSPLLIGRGLRGLEVPDPLVSLQHARIEWRTDHFVVVDLNSATGTRVNGEKIPPERGEPIDVDTLIVIGETTFQVVERHAMWRRAAEIAVVASGALAVLAFLAWLLVPRGGMGSTLVWYEEIAQGSHKAQVLELDHPYLRRRGIDPTTLRIRRVTDTDQNGIDEVWMPGPDGKERVITFDPTGRWVDLGVVPTGCLDMKGGVGASLPMLECKSVTWAVLDTGRYQPLKQDGIVLWGVPRDAWKQPGIPPSSLVKPYRGTLRRETAFAGFLAANGVDEPVHYLICERAFEKVRPAVLLQSGELRPLSQGCGQLVQIAGEDLWDVRAIAFTAGGHAALVDDVEVFLSGSVDGIFRDEKVDELSKAWRQPPVGMSARRVTFDAPDHYFEAVAAEEPVPGVRELPHDRPRVPPLAQTSIVVGTGVVQVDPPGCPLLEVETEPWSCSRNKGCVPSTSFLRIRSIGCGVMVPIEVPYSGGVFDTQLENLDIRLRVDSSVKENSADVIQVRVAWREKARY